MRTRVVFVQGAGHGAHDEDAALVASLRGHLGDGFTVDYPRMPLEDDPDYVTWRPAIEDAISSSDTPVVLVGHSVGGHLLLTYLATEDVAAPVLAVCIVAAPFPGGDAEWTFEGFELPEHLADRLPRGATLFLYASEDDAVVPFTHRDQYAAVLPGAFVRTTSGGHQLGNDLRSVADDIRAVRDRAR